MKRITVLAIAVRILPVTSVSDVPTADRLSKLRILGYDAVVAKNPDGSHRFAPGDLVVYIPEGCVLPDSLLQELGFWGPHPTTGIVQGTLRGANGNVVKPATMRKQLTTGIVLPVPDALRHLPETSDVADHFGITEWIPPIAPSLLSIARPLFSAKTELEIPRLKMYPGFLDGEEVVLTEKLEGECIQMIWMGGEHHEGLHAGGQVAITTKGMGREGLVFRDVPEAAKVPILRAIADTDLLDKFLWSIRSMDVEHERVRLFSEAIGAGVKFHYDSSVPTTRSFDLRIGERWLQEDERAAVFADAAMPRVPVLWRGIFDMNVVEEMREGPSTLGDKNMREGVVATSTGPQDLRRTALGDCIRPSLKYHSDRFLRKFGLDD